MSDTYRDRRKYVLKHHREVCTCRVVVNGWVSYSNPCVCDHWLDYRWYDFPEPSWWNRDQRRADKAFTRNLMQRARTGHIDWSAVDEERGKEWYW